MGASSGVGRALATELGKAGCTVTLAARDHRDIEAIAQHIRIAHGVTALTYTLDLETSFNIDFSIYDAVFLTAGMSLTRDDAGDQGNKNDLTEIFQKVMAVNLLGPAKLILSAFSEFKQRSSPTYIGICSTIAAPIPRSKNIIYAAAKNGLESIVKSLQYAATGSPMSIQIFRLGYVDSNLSYGQNLLFPVSSPEAVAISMISSAKKSKNRLIYLPNYWRYIVLTIKMLPWSIFTRLRF